MKKLPFYLVNVFAKTHFGGNPLAVFPQADGLTDAQMQKIAHQFNLSETVFVFKPHTFTDYDAEAVADLRIFSPSYELPLAGHPTIGCSFLLKQLNHLPEHFIVNTMAKPVAITAKDNGVEIAIKGYEYHTSLASHHTLADTVGLQPEEIDSQAYWFNTGASQLLLKVLSKEQLFNAVVDKDKLLAICQQDNEPVAMLYLWYQEEDQVFVRFFFVQNGVLIQDSGTGSACANLGAYFIVHHHYPTNKTIYQGDEMDRPNRLSLRIDDQQTIYVGGDVIKVGQGEFYLPQEE